MNTANGDKDPEVFGFLDFLLSSFPFPFLPFFCFACLAVL